MTRGLDRTLLSLFTLQVSALSVANKQTTVSVSSSSFRRDTVGPYAVMKIVKEGIEEIRSGRSLFCREIQLGGETSKFNLVLLHGTCAASAQFDLLLDALEKEGLSSHCYLYDAVGCGRSPMLPTFDAYHTNEQILDLKAILDTRIEQTRPTLILGHSYAPTIILRYLAQNKQSCVRACIFLSTAIHGGPLPIPDGGHPIFKLPVFLLKCLQPTLTKGFLQIAFDPSADPALIEASRVSSNKFDMAMCQWYHRHHQFANQEEAMAAKALPVLILHGVSDGVIPKEGGQHLADCLGENSVFKLVDNASHQVMEERPLQVATDLKAFVDGLAL
jgi:pimeloyl-ACP methyl ester carboxylesterase